MNKAEDNYQIIRQIQDGRDFLLTMLEQNPSLLKTAEPRIRELFEYEGVAQGGVHVQGMLTTVEQVENKSKPFSHRGKGGDGGSHV